MGEDKGLVIIVDAGLDAVWRRFREAFKPARGVSVHEVPPGKVEPLRAVVRAAESGPAPLPHPDSSPRAGKGGRCAVCSSGRRAEIDDYLRRGLTPHAIEKMIAPGPSDDSIRSHAAKCMAVKP